MAPLCRVPGHSDNGSNERADALANRVALSREPPNLLQGIQSWIRSEHEKVALVWYFVVHLRRVVGLPTGYCKT